MKLCGSVGSVLKWPICVMACYGVYPFNPKDGNNAPKSCFATTIKQQKRKEENEFEERYNVKWLQGD